jgi:hypothetical protein
VHSQEEGVSAEVSRQVAVTKAKLAAMTFEDNKEHKRRLDKETKAARAKEKKKRGVQAKISKKVRFHRMMRAAMIEQLSHYALSCRLGGCIYSQERVQWLRRVDV